MEKIYIKSEQYKKKSTTELIRMKASYEKMVQDLYYANRIDYNKYYELKNIIDKKFKAYVLNYIDQHWFIEDEINLFANIEAVVF